MKTGFTLIELLIVLAIFAILMLVGTDMFLSVVQNSNRSAMQSDIRQNASKILQDMTGSIRQASCVTWTNNVNTDTILTTYYDNSCQSAHDVYNFVWDPAVAPVKTGKVFKNGLQISSNGISTLLCNSCQPPCINGLIVHGTSGTNQSLTISLSAQSTISATAANACAWVALNDTVAPRSY